MKNNTLVLLLCFIGQNIRAAAQKRSHRTICNCGSQHQRHDFIDKGADRNKVDACRPLGCDEGEQSESAPLHKARFFFFAEVHPRKKYVTAVERRDGQNIENKQSEIDRRRIQEHVKNGFVHGKQRQRRNAPACKPEQFYNKKRDDAERKVRQRACKRDDDSVPSRMRQIPRVERNGFCPAETRDDDKQKTDRVDVFDRIEGKPSVRFCRSVSELVRSERMAVFMQRKPDDDPGQGIQGIDDVEMHTKHCIVFLRRRQYACDVCTG